MLRPKDRSTLMLRWVRHTARLSAALCLSLPFGCASGGVQSPIQPGVEPAVQGLPNVRASLHRDPVYGGHYYLLEAGPTRTLRPPILLVHGLGDRGVQDWYPVMRSLSQQHRVVAIDLPGFGRSDHANAHYNPTDYARLLAHVIRVHLRVRADVVGHSMGAAIALVLAGVEPNLVRRLVLVDVAGILCREALVTEMARPAAEDTSYVAAARREASTWFHELVTGFASLVPDLSTLLSSAIARKTLLGGDPTRIAALALLATNFNRTLDRVRAPTLLLWGERDTIAPRRTFDLLSIRLRVVDAVLLPNVGHNPMAQSPSAVTSRVLPFLDAPVVVARRRSDPTRATQSARSLTCRGERNRVYEGDLGRIELEGCYDVVFRNARIETLVARNSTVELTHVHIDQGMKLVDTRLRATASVFEGEPALSLERSTADLAGVRVQSRGPGITVVERGRVVGSVSYLDERERRTSLHGVFDLTDGQRL